MTFSNSEHTVKRFDVEIQQLVNLVLAMGRGVEQQVKRAITVFQEGDAEAAQAVIAGDAAINRWDMEIDRSCVRLLSRRQPMSTDLRLVIALNKAVNDLERIGDEAKTIAEKTRTIHARGDLRLLDEAANALGVDDDLHEALRLALLHRATDPRHRT